MALSSHSSPSNDRERSRIARSNNTIRLDGPFFTMDLKYSHAVISNIAADDIIVQKGFSRKWLLKQRRIRHLSVGINRTRGTDYMLYIPPTTLQKTSIVNYDISGVPTARSSIIPIKKTFRVPKNIQNSNVFVDIDEDETCNHFRFCNTISKNLRYLSLRSKEFKLHLDYYGQQSISTVASRLKNSIRCSKSLNKLTLIAFEDYSAPVIHPQVLCGVQQIHSLAISLFPGGGWVFDQDDFRAWDCLQQLSSLRKIKIQFLEGPNSESEVCALLSVLNQLPSLSKVKICLSGIQPTVPNFLKGLLKVANEIKFERFELCFDELMWDSEAHLKLFLDVFSRLTGRAAECTVQAMKCHFRVLKFKMLRKEGKYVFDKIETKVRDNFLNPFEFLFSKLFREVRFDYLPLELLMVSKDTREISIDLAMKNENTYKIMEFFSESLSNCINLTRLNLTLHSPLDSSSSEEILEKLFINVLPRLSNITTLNLEFRGYFARIRGSVLLLDLAKSLSELANLRVLKLQVSFKNFGEISLKPLADAIRGLAKLEELEIHFNENVIGQKDILLMLEVLAGLKRITHLQLQMTPPLEGIDELIETVPQLVNRLGSARFLDLNFCNKNWQGTRTDLNKFLKDLRKNVVHQETMIKFRVRVMSEIFHLIESRLQKLPANWR